MSNSKLVSTSYTIQVDLDRAFKFMRTAEALRPMTQADTGDPFLSHHIGKKPRDVLWKYIKRNVHADPHNRHIGHVRVDYTPSEIGAALIDAGLIEGCRVDATGDPFKLPMRLNEVLTGSLYHNADLSKAYQRFMRAMTQVPEAIAVLDEFLADPNAVNESVGLHYFGKYDPEVKERVKRAIHSLSMDKKLRAVRRDFVEEFGVPEGTVDHPFLVRYAHAMPLVTEEFATTVRGRAAIALIREKFPHRNTKGPNGEDRPRDARLTWKSYVLQEFEWRCRRVMMKAAAPYGFGSQEHDGLKVCITPATPASTDLDAAMTDAVSSALGAHLPVETKPPAPFVFTSHDLEPRFYVPPGRIDDERELAMYHRMMLDWCNWHLAYLTGMADGVVVTPRQADGSYDIERLVVTTSGKLIAGRRGMDVPKDGKWEEKVDRKTGEVVSRTYKLGERVSLMTWWLEHCERRPYRCAEFDPRGVTEGVFNLYQGLPFDKLVITPDASLLDPLLDHIREVLANGDETVYNYQLDWYARALQFKEKLGTMLIYFGAMGTGKDLLVGDDGIMALIYGGAEGGHYQKMASIEELTQKFTADAEKVLFATLTEVTPYNGRRNNDAVKDKVTSKTARHEKKGVDQKAIKDYRNLTATTNNRDGFKIDLGDRRLNFIEVNDRWAASKVQMGDIKADERQRYFANVLGARVGEDEPARSATHDEKVAVAQQLHHFLMNRDVSHFNAEDFPETAARKEVIAQHKPPLEAFFDAWASGGLMAPEFVQELDFSTTEDPVSRVWYARDLKKKFDVFNRTEYGARAIPMPTVELSRSLRNLSQYIRPHGGRATKGQKYVLAGHPEFGNGGVEAPAWAGVDESAVGSGATGLSAEPPAKRARVGEALQGSLPPPEGDDTGVGNDDDADLGTFDEQEGTDELL